MADTEERDYEPGHSEVDWDRMRKLRATRAIEPAEPPGDSGVRADPPGNTIERCAGNDDECPSGNCMFARRYLAVQRILDDVLDPDEDAEGGIETELRRAFAVIAAQAARDERQARDAAYAERDQLVAALSKCFPSHLARHEGADWEDDWRNIVCIHLPAGQATWHIHDRELPWFAHLPTGANHWDSHTTAEKYDRLAQLSVYHRAERRDFR